MNASLWFKIRSNGSSSEKPNSAITSMEGMSKPSTELTTGKYIKTAEGIDRIHKWRPRNYSFVFVLIILTNLNLKQKFFEFVCADAASDDD